jgi:hypothetical protein
MSIVKTVTDEHEFWGWLKNSDNYKNNFSFEGAKAVQSYYEQLSDDLGENIEFDPVAWCCEWAEYDNVAEAYEEHYGDASDLPIEQQRTQEAQQFEYFEDNTTIIKLDTGHVLVQEF